MTALPRPLSAHLLTAGLNARPITWPTVPKGKDRVRVCLHAGNTREDVDRLVDGMLAWAHAEMRERERERKERARRQAGRAVGVLMESKL